MRATVSKVIFIIIITIFSSVGCWDSSDVEDKNIVTGVIVDYKDDQYYFSVETANIKSTKIKNGNMQMDGISSVIEAQGKSFDAARDNINRKSDNIIFLGAVRVLIFTDSMAKKGIEEYINRTRGKFDYRKTVQIAVTSSKPEEFIRIHPENDLSTAFAIEDTLINLYNKGRTYDITNGKILEILAVKEVGFLVPNVIVINGENTISGYSVFKNAKKIGDIPAEERKGEMYLLLPNASFIYEVNYNGNNIAIISEMNNRRIKAELLDDKITFNINININSKLQYMDRLTPINDNEQKKIEEYLKDMIKEDIEKAINRSQDEYECDYLEFYKYFRMKYSKEFKKLNWNSVYSDARMNTTVNVKMVSTGLLEIDPKVSE